MFSSMSQIPGLNFPQFATKRALIIVNAQNDSLHSEGETYVTKSQEWADRIKDVVPYFRKLGDVIWVRTEFVDVPAIASKELSLVEREIAKMDQKNREDRRLEEEQLEDDTRGSPLNEPQSDLPLYHPTSRAKAMMTRASAEDRAEQRTANMDVFNDKDNILEEQMTKPRKGKAPRFMMPGTWGAQIADRLLPVLDMTVDSTLVKHHYSGFEDTSLLMSLRMKLVTDVYLCGCLTNVSVYATAADAVQHGLGVTVVEDCLGYRSEEKHEDAMRQMADIMGVDGIDSQEIIEEAGGIIPPDALSPRVTGRGTGGVDIETLSLDPTSERNIKAESNTQDGSFAESASPPGKRRIREAAGKTGIRSSTKVKPEQEEKELLTAKIKKPISALRLGPNDKIGAGDSRIIYSALRSPLVDDAFERLKEEVRWEIMHHRSGQVPRLVAVQGKIDETGGIPIYRHPADESPAFRPFIPAIEQIRDQIEELLHQPFNHALIQLYRDGIDNISEHSDKTLDVVRGSSIVNVSLGAQRVMTLRTKKSKEEQAAKGSEIPRQTQRIPMPHNSLFVLGSQTNVHWLHGVRADKRPPEQRSVEEKAFGGERISITFRQIGTYMNEDQGTIWGQGAVGKTKADARRIRKGENAEIEAMIVAFGKENHQHDFDWDAEYGQGFDVIDLVPDKTQLFLCNDPIANLRVQLSLCEKGVPYKVSQRTSSQPSKARHQRFKSNPSTHSLSNTQTPVFKDVDEDASEVEGDLAILFYLEKFYPFPAHEGASARDLHRTSARMYSRVTQSNDLLFLWRNYQAGPQSGERSPPGRLSAERPVTPYTSPLKELERDMDMWEQYVAEGGYTSGSAWTLIDCAFWPVLNEIANGWEEFDAPKYPGLMAYHCRVLERECVQELMHSRE